MPITISPSGPGVEAGGRIQMRLRGTINRRRPDSVEWTVRDEEGNEIGTWTDARQHETEWQAIGVQPGEYVVRVRATAGGSTEEATERVVVNAPFRVVGSVRIDGPVRVDLQRPDLPDTPDLALWEVIKLGTEAISFDNYMAWMDYLFCGGELPASFYPGRDRAQVLPGGGRGVSWRDGRQRFHGPDQARAPLPFPDIDGYKVLKAATEAFLELNCGVIFDKATFPAMRDLSPSELEALGLEPGDTLERLWQKYLIHANSQGFIPYLYRVRQKLRDIDFAETVLEGELCN